MLNCAILMGRLTADPVLKTTTSGKEVCAFQIAVDRAVAVKGQRTADFINIVTWEGNARFVCNRFKKGQMIAVQGSVRTRSYEDNEGNKRTAFEVVAREVHFCGSKAETLPQSASQTTPSEKEPSQVEGINGYYANATAADFADICYDDEDLPL